VLTCVATLGRVVPRFRPQENHPMAYDQRPEPIGSGNVPAIGRPNLPDAGLAPVRLGKTRSPLGVWLLALITFGVYGLVWYYKVNRELRDYNGQIEVSP